MMTLQQCREHLGERVVYCPSGERDPRKIIFGKLEWVNKAFAFVIYPDTHPPVPKATSPMLLSLVEEMKNDRK